MEYEWNPNPLLTKAILSEPDMALLRKSIELDSLSNSIFEVMYDLERGAEKEAIISRLKAIVDSIGDGADDHLAENYKEALLGAHSGDCTYQPCACSKCLAESLLGIDTLGSYPGAKILHKIDYAYTQSKGEPIGALTYLRDNEYEDAYPWLHTYLMTHFPHLLTT